MATFFSQTMFQMKMKESEETSSIGQHFLSYDSQPVFVISGMEKDEKEKEATAPSSDIVRTETVG